MATMQIKAGAIPILPIFLFTRDGKRDIVYVSN